MCLAIPGKIEEINTQGLMTMAKVSFQGVIKDICIEWVPDVDIGDYVIVHAGFALNKIDQKEAEENLKMITELAESPDSYLRW